MAKKFYDDILKKYDKMVKTPKNKADELLYPNGKQGNGKTEKDYKDMSEPIRIDPMVPVKNPARIPGYNPNRTLPNTFGNNRQAGEQQNPSVSMPNVTRQLMTLPGFNQNRNVDNSIRFEGKKPQTTGAAKASTDYYWAKAMLDPENAWRDYKGASNMYFTQQRFGIQNNPGDNNIYLMSVDQLQEERKKQEKAKDEALREEEAYRNRTPEQIAAEKQGVIDANNYQGKLGIFANNGVPYGRNQYGEVMEVDPESYDANDQSIEYMKERPEDYWEATNRFQYDRLAYDFLNGAGAYDERVDQLETDEESVELDLEMDQIWDAIESGEIENQYQKAQENWNHLQQEESELSGGFKSVKSQEEIDRIGDEISRRETIAQLMSDAPENVSGAFDPSLVNPAEARENSWMNLYHLVNRDLNAENMSDYTRHLNAQPAMFMTPEMVDTFNKYYKAGDYVSAKAFYDALLPDLETLAANYKTNLEYMLSQNEYAPLMVGERLLTSPVAGVMGNIGSIAALFGDKTARRANSWYYDQTRANNVIQSARADAWAKQAEAWFPGSDFAQNAAKFLNGVVYSMADNIIALAAGKGLSVMAGAANSLAVTEAAVQIIMSSEATASMMKEQLDAGKDGTEAALMALGSGVIEAATEKFSLEALLKPDVRAMMKSGKGFAQYIFKNFLAEGSEEVASDVLTTVLDVILSQANGHENELMKEYQTLIDQGMGETEATRTVIWNMVQKLGSSFLAGGLSGLVMSASRGGAAKMSLMQENIRLGKAAMNSNVDSYLAKGTEATDKEAASSLSEGMQAAAAAQTKETKKAEMPDSTKANDKTTREAINKIRLLDTAVKMGPDSESGAIAADMKARIIKGERVSNAEYGALIRSIVNESSEEIGNIARDVMGEQFRQELIEAGEDKDTAEMHTKILLDMIVNNRHSALTAAMLADSPAAQKIMQEYKMRDSYNQYQKETKGWMQAKKNTLEMLGVSGTRQQIESMWKRMTNGAKDRMATEEEYNAAEGEKTGAAKEVIYDGKVAEVVGIRTETVNEAGKKMNRVLAVLSNGEEVDMNLVTTRNEGMARIMQFAHDDRNEMGSDGWINTVIKHFDDSVKDVGAFVQGAMSARVNSFLGIDSGKPASMSEEAYKEIKEQADREYNESEKDRVKNYKEIRPGQGKTTFMGVEYGTKEWTDAVKKLDKTQQKEANSIAAVNKFLGFEVNLVLDEKNTAEQGSYSATGGVTINLAGTYTKEGAHRSALATFAHELTHWLEGNSQEAYKGVRKFVLGTLQQYGVNLYKEMQRIYDSYAHEGVQLDMAGAVAEMVAKGCEQVLTDENLIRKLQEQDTGLYGKMKEAVNKMIGRIRGLRQANIDTSSWYAKMLMNVTDEIADKWMAAYEEALGTEGSATNENVQKSLQEKDGYDYLKPYEEQIDDVINGKHPERGPVFIGEMPNYFSKLNMPNLPFAIAKGHVKEMLGMISRDGSNNKNHFYGESFVKKLPSILQNPVAIIESTTPDQEKRENSIVLLFKDKNPYTGHFSIGAVEIETKFNLNGDWYDGYMLNTFHGRENAINMLVKAIDSEEKNNHGVFYINNKEAIILSKRANVNVDKSNRIGTFTKGGFIHTIDEAQTLVKTKPKKQTETQQFKRWFDKSRVTTDGKTPKIMYSGKLNGENNTQYFTERPESKRSKAVYLSVQKPYIIRSGETIEEALNRNKELLVNAKRNKNDGIITSDGSQVYVFEGTQVKSATDNIGTFDKEVDNRKLSVQEDTAYEDAVNSGDMETAQQIVDRAAKANGFTEKVYHGTPTGGFTVFRDWSYFTKNKAYADRYQHASASSIRGRYETTNPMTYELYMNPGKVFDTREKAAAKLYNEARMEYGLNGLDSTDSGLPDWTDGRDLIEFIEDRGLDYDTILLDEGADGGYGEEVTKRGISYVTRANRVKSAAPVTYDSKNNPVKPSERFNVKENDIRFSMQEPVEVNRDGLIAVHNLGEEQLMASLRLGGFPMPSIAIVKNDFAHNKYGDISVIFYPQTVDPKASKYNKVYGGDAWTPTYPTIEFKISGKAVNKLNDRVDALVPKNIQNGLSMASIDETNVKDAINRTRGDAVKALQKNIKLQLAYLADKGIKLDYPMQEAQLSSRFSNQEIRQIIEELGEDTIREAYMGPSSYIDEHPEIAETMRKIKADAWDAEIRKKIGNQNTVLKMARMNPYSKEQWGYSHTMDGIQGAWSYMQRGIRQVVDEKALKELVEKNLDEEGYEKWLRKELNGIIEKRGIRNNKDYYTNSGNPRSWEALHEEETLENVVRVMRSELDKGANAFFSQSQMLALGTRDFKSLDDIRAHKDQLRHISEEEYSAAKENIINEFSKLMDEMSDKSERNTFIARDRALEAMVEAVRKSKKAAGIMRELRQWTTLNIPADAGERIEALLKEIADLPTEYFEAKPQRAVTFDEIAKVILPENSNQKLLDALNKEKIAYETYDGTDEDRLRAVNTVNDAQFSIRDEQDIDVASWMESIPEWSLKTEAEKQLQRNYKSLRMKAQLQQEKIRKAYGELTRLEAIPEESRSEDTNKKIQAYRIRMENARTVLDQTEEKLAGITGSEGYARMMFQQNKILQDFLYGRTQGEVRRAVEKLEESAAAVARRIDENQKALDGMKSSGFLKRMKELLGTSTADQSATDLKKQFHSTWTKTQIRTYLDPIILKMTQGEDYTHDVEQLAGILIESDSRNTYEGLSALRGLTITLGPGAQKELRAQNSSLKEVRARLAGTGITVKYGERSSLETDIEDLRAEFPNIPNMGDEKDALNNFLDWVDGLKEASGSKEFYNERLAETMAVVMQKAAGTAQGIYMPTEAKAQQQVLALIEFVKGLSAETQAAQQTMQEVADEMKQLRDAGVRARGMADALESDVTSAIEYYNKTAELAEQTAKKNRQDALIEQLKSKHAEQIAKNNEAWRDLIERDKEARATAEKNQKERAKIDLMFRRILKRMNTKDATKNIPERMRPLARQILELLLNNDMVDEEGFRGKKLTYSAQKPLQEAARLIRAWAEQDGKFDINDLYDMFSDDVASVIMSDISTLDNALTEWNKEIRGKDKGEILEARHRILQDISGSIAEIYDAIMKENEVFVNGRSMSREIAAYNVMTGTRGQMHREWTGKLGGIIRTLHKAIVSGNMTPEYFFRTLRNDGLNVLWDEYHRAENRNGLELKKAQAKLAAIAEKYGYANWDTQKKIRVPFASGDVQMTIGQIMSLYATWQREKTLGPEMSEHLSKGGFFVEQDMRDGILGRTVMQKKAHRVSDAGMARIAELLTPEQKAYVDDVVQYMSSDLSKLGNEASMAAYGIKLYKEKYYFPFQIWNGIKNMKSNDSGAAAQNQAFHPSFSKSRLHGANNALIIGDFNQTVADHIVGMINYATMGLANDTLNKVLNTQMPEDAEDPKVTTKRNVRAILEEAYGRTALQYLMDLKVQLEGGVKAAERSLGDKAISIFRKNAVAGSLSVAFQQPLSYIRAAMLINPKYLAAAMNPKTWKGSYEEMLAHSGVAVIKDMGRFDVGFGQSARDYIVPEGMQTKAQKAWQKVSDATTVLPELMDRMTWTRMWSACKAEQAALHPEMDPKSEEFLNLVGERFNELMRRTQVYDSTLVRSQNMRSQNYWMKGITSFMAEPTLTLNVLADSVRSALQGENGGKALMAKAGATFLLSAILQALVKGAFSSGRSPDKKKTWLENFLNRFGTNLVNEANPFSMIPGYNDLVSLLKNGELSDDAMGALGKMFTAYGKGRDLITGNGSGDVWRDIEDSAAQIAQLFGNVPAKNIMRDMRAMYNWITGAPYANRATDPTVIRYKAEEAVGNADSLLSAMIQLLTGAGFEAKNATYYERLYQAKKAGREQEANDLVSYLLNGRGVKDEKTIESKVNALAKDDKTRTTQQTFDFLQENGYGQMGGYVKDLYREGKITRAEAEKMYKEANPKAKAQDVLKALDEVDYEKETGEEVESYSNYTPVYDAIDAGNTSEANRRIEYMKKNGYAEKDINSTIKSYIVKQYKEGTITRQQAEDRLKTYRKDMTADDIFWALDEVDYEKKTGEDVSGQTYRLHDAIDANDTAAVKKESETLVAHGMKPEKVNDDVRDYIKDQYKDGKITRQQAENKLKTFRKDMSKDDIFWALDRIDYKKETGKDAGSGTYYRLKEAISSNKSDQIRNAVQVLLAHGGDKKNIKSWIGSKNTGFKTAYLEAKGNDKVRIKNALIMAYKAVGVSESEANKIINGWKEDKNKSDAGSGNLVASTGVAQPDRKTKDSLMWQTMYRNTEGVLKGKGNIDLNHRKVVYNDDGSISTEFSFSFYDEDSGKEVLIPTVVNGRIVSEDEAINHYYETGEYLGKFNTPEEAEEYAELLHERQDWYYNEYLPNKAKGITGTGR